MTLQGAENSKTMFPCKRRVHLHQSIIFQTVFKQLLTNHENDAKNDPEMTEPKYTICLDCSSHFGANCLIESMVWRVLFATFSRNF